MASPTSFPIDQEAAPAPINPALQKRAVSVNPSPKDPDEVRVDTLEVIATQDDETEAKPAVSTKAMRRKASIQFVVLCMGNFVCGWNAGVLGPLGPRFLEAYHVRGTDHYAMDVHDGSLAGRVFPLVDQLLYDGCCMSH